MGERGLRYAIVGAGAIGGFVGAALARAGRDVTLIARGPHLEAMREAGITIREADGQFTVHPQIESSMEAIERADVAVVALKAHQLDAAAAHIAAHLRPGAALVSMQNGIPWWFFQRVETPLEGIVLRAVDPERRITDAIPYDAVVGSVVYASCEVVQPGVIAHTAGSRILIGEPSGAATDRVNAIVADLAAGGLRASAAADIRAEIFGKLLGNAAFNPISALTRSTSGAMLDDPGVAALIRAIMTEVSRLGRAAGAVPPGTIEKRMEAARAYGDVRSSMLQDLLAHRPLEIEPMLGAVVELGERIGVDVSACRHVYALTKLLDANMRRESIVARA